MEFQLRPRWPTRVGIVGFAGGHVPPPANCHLNRDLFDKMVSRAEQIIQHTFSIPLNAVNLVSGGAPWSDHVAVVLAHKAASLKICAPAPWDATTGRFVDNGTGSFWKTNPGAYENTLHEQFATATGVDSFTDLRSVTVSSHKGFHARNSVIASTVDFLIAFTWSSSSEPTDGGTKDTWKKAKAFLPAARMVHVSMWDLTGTLPTMSSDAKQKGISTGPEAEVGKKPKPKKGATKKVVLKLVHNKSMGDNMFALVADDQSFDMVHRLEVHAGNGQTIKLDGPFTSIALIKTGATAKDKVSITLGNTGTGVAVCAEKPE